MTYEKFEINSSSGTYKTIYQWWLWLSLWLQLWFMVVVIYSYLEIKIAKFWNFMSIIPLTLR